MASKSPTNALFVCKECGRLAAILGPLWHEFSDLLNNKPHKIASQILEKPILLEKYKSISYYVNIDEINEIGQYFSQYDIPFPICNECLSLWGRNLKHQIHFLQITNEEYQSLNIPDNSTYSRTKKAEIGKINQSIETYEDTSASFKQQSFLTNLKSREHSTLPFSQSIDTIRSLSHPSSPSTTLNLTQRPTRKYDSSIFLRHPSFLNCVVFRIQFYGFWGMINSCRFGISSGQNEISANEFNIGLFFLSHLILSIAPLFQMEISNLFLQIPVTIINANGQKLLLNAEYLYSKWKINNFNNAFHEFMKICSSLFRNRELNTDHLAPPFHINLQDKTISGESYIYNRNNIDGWTRALKSLLENFKFIQTWANSCTMYSLNQQFQSNSDEDI